MKQYKTTTVTRDVRHICSRTCDLCGREAKNPLDNIWGNTRHDNVDETEIEVIVRQKEGFTCPDGGWGNQHEIDLCPTCFKERLIPWLVSQGAKITQEEWSW